MRRGSRRLGGAAVVAAALAAAASACDADGDPHCVVARSPGFQVSVADAEALRSLIRPAPGVADARRLAVDVAIAHADAGGSSADPSERKLASYSAWLSRTRVGDTPLAKSEAAAEAMRLARIHHAVERGPCHPGG